MNISIFLISEFIDKHYKKLREKFLTIIIKRNKNHLLKDPKLLGF